MSRLSPLFVAFALGCAAPRDVVDAAAPRVLDGTETSILVVGYSTSYAWPAMLQDMLDAHAGGRRIYHVLNAVVGGAPVASWIAEPGTREHERTVGAMVDDYLADDARLRGDAPFPSVAICQQSLQLTRDERGPVKSGHDMVGAEMGADALEVMATRLHELGIRDVRIAMHIYKRPVEPEVGNERVALARLLERGLDFVHAGPDVWTPTRDHFPDAFEEDGLHPNLMGNKIMAEGWYRALAGPDAREGVIDALWEADYDYRRMMRDYLATRR